MAEIEVDAQVENTEQEKEQVEKTTRNRPSYKTIAEEQEAYIKQLEAMTSKVDEQRQNKLFAQAEFTYNLEEVISNCIRDHIRLENMGLEGRADRYIRYAERRDKIDKLVSHYQELYGEAYHSSSLSILINLIQNSDGR